MALQGNLLLKESLNFRLVSVCNFFDVNDIEQEFPDTGCKSEGSWLQNWFKLFVATLYSG